MFQYDNIPDSPPKQKNCGTRIDILIMVHEDLVMDRSFHLIHEPTLMEKTAPMIFGADLAVSTAPGESILNRLNT